MKHWNLVIWLTQLGISVAVPLGGFVLLAVWLRQRFEWGSWVIITGVVLGVICAVNGLITSLKAMEKMAGADGKDPPPVSFNNHD